MGTRHERVVLELEDHGFSTKMVRNAAATALLDKTLDNLDGTAVRTTRNMPATSREVETLGRSAARSDSSINQLTGRLRLMADTAAVLGPSLVPISAVAVPALTGLASQVGVAALGMGTLVVASQGVGDALKAVNDASLDPTVANLEKAAEAMERLGPDAQEFVSRFQELRPVLGDIRDSAAAGWFPGLTDSLDSLDRMAPRIASTFEAIGRAGGNLVAEGAAALAGPQWGEFLRFVETNAPQALDELGRTVGNVARGLAELWMAFDPLNDDFSGALLDASRSFAEWSEDLSSTRGFQEFVEYIRTNGPRVADALMAVGDAVLQIIEALAPLGGPSLQIIESFAKVIGAIADSDLGTPIFAAVAAFAALNRAMQVTAALQTRMTGSRGLSAALASGGVVGGLKQARSGLSGLNRDLKTTAVTAGKAGAVLGGLAVASSGVADGIGLSNTAALGLMGTFAGPWGAALGVGVGLTMDVVSANRSWEESIKAVKTAIDSGNVESMTGQIDDLKDKLAELREVESPEGFVDTTKSIVKGMGWWITGNDVDERIATTQQQIASLEAAAERSGKAQGILSDGLTESAAAAGMTSSELRQLTSALDQHTQTALNAFDAETAWREAMRAAAAQANTNNAGIRGNTDAANKNRQELSRLAGAWANQRAAMEASGASAGAVNRKFQQTRRAFIETAVAMGVPRAAARALAAQLLALPEKKKIDVVLNAGAAQSTLRTLKAELAGVQSKTVTVTINGRRTGATVSPNEPLGAGMIPRAYGGYTGPGGKYEPAGIVHRGEVVIPQELVKRDKSLLMSRYGHLPNMDELPRHAAGGLVGYASGGRVPALPFADLPGLNLAAIGLRGLNRALRASQKALEDEKSEREAVVDKMRTLSSDVAGGLRSELFSGDKDPWSSGHLGGSFGDVIATLRGDISRGTAYTADVGSLKRKGLSGPALEELLSNASPEQVDMFEKLTKAQLAQYSRLIKVRADVTNNAGGLAANATYGAELAKQTREMRLVAARVASLERTVKAEERENRRSAKRGAGNGARSRKRG
jgi:hypothetical protein